MGERTLFQELRIDGTLRARVWLEGERVLASGPDVDEHLRDCVLDLSLKLDAALAERDAAIARWTEDEEALHKAEARAERAEAFIRRCLADGGYQHERDAQRARALLAPEAQRPDEP